MTYDPGADALARYPDVIVRHKPLGGMPAAVSRRHQLILINSEMTRVEQRCALAHEIAHFDLGHGQAIREGFEERQADELAASRLIPLEDLADVLRWALGPEEVADVLNVTPRLVRRRVRALTGDEKEWIEGEMRRKEEIA